MSEQKQTPPTQSYQALVTSGERQASLAESTSSALRAKTPQEDMFVIGMTAFKDFCDVWPGLDSQPSLEVELKQSTSRTMKSLGDSGPQVPNVRSYHWTPQTPIPGMMQTIGLVPLSAGGLEEETILPDSPALPERDLGLVVVMWDSCVGNRNKYCFRSKFLFQKNPLMLPAIEVTNDNLPAEDERKLRDVLTQRKEKLGVLILLYQENIENVLLTLGRVEDLLSDVTTVVLGDALSCGSVYVIDLTGSSNRVATIVELATTLKFLHTDEESFKRTMIACSANKESWHVVEATVHFNSSLERFVSGYPKPPNIYLKSVFFDPMSREMASSLSVVRIRSYPVVDLAEFPNLRSLDTKGFFRNSPEQPFHGLHHLSWSPRIPTKLHFHPWSALSDLRCLMIDGNHLQPGSVLSLQDIPKLVSLHLERIGKDIVFDFGDQPWRLHALKLGEFQGSFQGTSQLKIDNLFLQFPVCDPACLDLCPKAQKVDMVVFDPDGINSLLASVAGQLKSLKLRFYEFNENITQERLSLSILRNTFPLLESLELTHCDVTLSAAIFPRLHRLVLQNCDVSFPRADPVSLYGNSFPELFSLKMTNCKLSLKNQGWGGLIRLRAASLSSLTLIDMPNPKVLKIHKDSFPRLQSLTCHVDKCGDFPFPVNDDGAAFFPHLRFLSLKKKASNGQEIVLSSITDMRKLQTLELLDNAFVTFGGSSAICCRWVRFSSSVVKHESAKKWDNHPLRVMAENPANVQLAAFLANAACKQLLIDRHVVQPIVRHAYMGRLFPIFFGVWIPAQERFRLTLRQEVAKFDEMEREEEKQRAALLQSPISPAAAPPVNQTASSSAVKMLVDLEEDSLGAPPVYQEASPSGEPKLPEEEDVSTSIVDDSAVYDWEFS